MTYIATRCPRCGKDNIGSCDCSQKAMQGVGYPWPAPLPPWNLPVKHEPQDDKLDKIIALLEQIKERL